jgi:hypothetical protein
MVRLLRHRQTKGPVSARPHLNRLPRVASDPLCLHAVATTPAGLMELIRSYRSINFGLPQITDYRWVGSCIITVSRPALRSLALQPTGSPSRPERSSSRAGLFSRCGPAPSTAHCNCLISSLSNRHISDVKEKAAQHIRRPQAGPPPSSCSTVTIWNPFVRPAHDLADEQAFI